MLYRVLIGTGLWLLGYYVGREIGRCEHVRRELAAKRHHNGASIRETRRR